MKQALKELIDKADLCVDGVFNEFLIIPTHEEYDGFWGKNGYENMIVLARGFEEDSDSWHRISQDQCDVFDLCRANFSLGIDIPCEYGCVRISSHDSIKIFSPASSIRGEAINKKKQIFETESEEERLPNTTPIIDDNTYKSSMLAEMGAFRYEFHEINNNLENIYRALNKGTKL